ncbi:metalloregulator ArsR/SmtB family transcription factor [soil metagenome]
MQPPIGDAFAALGDPTRRRIVELLAAHDGRSVGQLASELPISRPGVSRHLALLKRAGLVVDEPRGTRRIYRLQAEGVDAVRGYLEQLWGQTAHSFRHAAEGKSGQADR